MSKTFGCNVYVYDGYSAKYYGETKEYNRKHFLTQKALDMARMYRDKGVMVCDVCHWMHIIDYLEYRLDLPAIEKMLKHLANKNFDNIKEYLQRYGRELYTQNEFLAMQKEGQDTTYLRWVNRRNIVTTLGYMQHAPSAFIVPVPTENIKEINKFFYEVYISIILEDKIGKGRKRKNVARQEKEKEYMSKLENKEDNQLGTNIKLATQEKDKYDIR